MQSAARGGRERRVPACVLCTLGATGLPARREAPSPTRVFQHVSGELPGRALAPRTAAVPDRPQRALQLSCLVHNLVVLSRSLSAYHSRRERAPAPTPFESWTPGESRSCRSRCRANVAGRRFVNGRLPVAIPQFPGWTHARHRTLVTALRRSGVEEARSGHEDRTAHRSTRADLPGGRLRVGIADIPESGQPAIETIDRPGISFHFASGDSVKADRQSR